MPLESVDILPTPPIGVEDEHMDYFLRRDDLKIDLLANDDDFCCSLIKQYARKAQVIEKELASATELLGEDGITLLTAKKNDLYNCCFAGFAKMNWDFVRIARGIPSARFRSLLKQLVIMTFTAKPEVAKKSENDVFNALNGIPLADFTEETIFTVWLYARWIVFIDRTARFPIIVTKQTVANPAATTDPALLQAEQHGRCIYATRQQTAKAVAFLTKLEKSNITRIRVPTIDCFINKHPMNTENFINMWEIVIRPDFGASSVFLSMEDALNRTRYELLVANFSANHFRTAKKLCQQLLEVKRNFDSIETAALPYVQFDFADVEFYAKALSITPIGESAKQRDSLVAKAQEVKQIADAKTVAVASRLQNENSSKLNAVSQLRANAASFFLNQLNSSASTVSVPPVRAPTAMEFDSFPSSGPYAFFLYTSINANHINSLLDVQRSSKPAYSFPERYEFSPNLAEVIHRYVQKNMEKYFIIIGKIQQLYNVHLPRHWEAMLNLLIPKLSESPTNKASIDAALIIETLEVKILQNYTSLQSSDEELFSMVKNAYLGVNATSNMCIRFLRCLFPALLNTGRAPELVKVAVKCADDHVVPFTTALVALIEITTENNAPTNTNSSVKKLFYQNYVKVLKNFSFDTQNKSLYTFPNFITMLHNLSHPIAIRLLLSYTLQMYNKSIQEYPQHFLIAPAQRACYVLGDTYILNEPIKFGRIDVMGPVLGAILVSANRFLAADPYVLRATGDYLFTRENYECALRNYLNCLLVCTRHLSQPLLYYQPCIDDVFWKKIITCLIELKRPTEAAITGHLIIQMFDFFPHVVRILEPTLHSLDAMEAYFPLIGDIAIFEAMSSAYGKLGFKGLQQKLLTSVLTKSFHANGSKIQLMHEGLRRKTNWIRVLCSRVFIEK